LVFSGPLALAYLVDKRFLNGENSFMEVTPEERRKLIFILLAELLRDGNHHIDKQIDMAIAYTDRALERIAETPQGRTKP
jgi:hypothetical protein